MTIELKDRKIDDLYALHLSDYDVEEDEDNFVDLSLEIEGEIVGKVRISVDELISAASAFSRKR